MSLTMSPVVLAADLLDRTCRAAVDAAFEIKGIRLTCIMLGFYQGTSETVLSAETHVIVDDNGKQGMLNWREIMLRLDPHEQFVLSSAILNLHLMSDIPDVLRRIGVNSARPNHPFVNLCVFRRAVIASQDGFDDWVIDRRAAIEAAPHRIDNRAGVCTIIGPLAESHHEALSLVGALKRDFKAWAQVQELNFDILKEHMNLTLMPPTDADLLAVYDPSDVPQSV